jgi:hypothetical protein
VRKDLEERNMLPVGLKPGSLLSHATSTISFVFSFSWKWRGGADTKCNIQLFTFSLLTDAGCYGLSRRELLSQTLRRERERRTAASIRLGGEQRIASILLSFVTAAHG